MSAHVVEGRTIADGLRLVMLPPPDTHMVYEYTIDFENHLNLSQVGNNQHNYIGVVFAFVWV